MINFIKRFIVNMKIKKWPNLLTIIAYFACIITMEQYLVLFVAKDHYHKKTCRSAYGTFSTDHITVH